MLSGQLRRDLGRDSRDRRSQDLTVPSDIFVVLGKWSPGDRLALDLGQWERERCWTRQEAQHPGVPLAEQDPQSQKTPEGGPGQRTSEVDTVLASTRE